MSQTPPSPPSSHDRADAELMRVSDFQRRHPQQVQPQDAEAGATRLASLNPSLLQDLLRFERTDLPGEGLDVMEVLAAALRHNRALLLHLQIDYRVIALTVHPAERRLQAPLTLRALLELRLPELRVLRVEPAAPQRSPDAEPAEPQYDSPLAPLLWELALRGAREALLPEIAGVAAYRVTPGADLGQLDLTGSLATAVRRLREQTTPLREIAGWPGFDKSRATRLLNGLYLQAALMISRSHPGAI